MEDNTVFEIDPELLAGFIDEAEEGLATLDNLFIELEAQPGKVETINAIFRPVHTIKGNSAFFGLLKVKQLAHEMETLLMLAKEGKLHLNQSVVGVLLAGVDELKAILVRAREGKAEVIDEEAFGKLVAKVIASREKKVEIIAMWDDLFGKFEKFKSDVANLDANYTKQLDLVIEIAAQLKNHSAGGEKQSTKDEKTAQTGIPQPLQKIKSVLEKANEDGLSKEEAQDVLASLTALKDFAANKQAQTTVENAILEYQKISESGGIGESFFVELLQEMSKKLLQITNWKTTGQDSETRSGTPESKTAAARSKAGQEAGKTMRVAEDTIDNFLSFVGELIVVGKMYDYLQKNIAAGGLKAGFVKDFKRVNETFDSLSASLQKSIMEIRKVPVRTILQKAPRMVHDIAVANGKEIKVQLVGDEIEIDKRLVEILDGPLTHMVRNAADHGVEKPEARQAAGKARQGNIVIAVTETKDNVTLTITDDGKGINLDAIKAKGVNLGIVKPDQKLTEEQIIDLLFISGVSTAEKVTEVSGRGVGMDVVKRNVDIANGKIIINTKQGQGTEFIIRLPKTVSTQIIDGFLVKVSSNCYVIPMDKVQEVFRPETQDLSSVTERNECVLRHKELLPIVKLSKFFGDGNESEQDNGDKIMVSTHILKRRMALCVDAALGVQKVVLKDFGQLELNSEFYSAAAVMGDGTVAMVLDVDKIAGFAAGA